MKIWWKLTSFYDERLWMNHDVITLALVTRCLLFKDAQRRSGSVTSKLWLDSQCPTPSRELPGQTGPGMHSVSCPVGTSGSVANDKTDGTLS